MSLELRVPLSVTYPVLVPLLLLHWSEAHPVPSASHALLPAGVPIGLACVPSEGTRVLRRLTDTHVPHTVSLEFIHFCEYCHSCESAGVLKDLHLQSGTRVSGR